MTVILQIAGWSSRLKTLFKFKLPDFVGASRTALTQALKYLIELGWKVLRLLML